MPGKALGVQLLSELQHADRRRFGSRGGNMLDTVAEVEGVVGTRHTRLPDAGPCSSTTTFDDVYNVLKIHERGARRLRFRRPVAGA